MKYIFFLEICEIGWKYDNGIVNLEFLRLAYVVNSWKVNITDVWWKKKCKLGEN